MYKNFGFCYLLPTTPKNFFEEAGRPGMRLTCLKQKIVLHVPFMESKEAFSPNGLFFSFIFFFLSLRCLRKEKRWSKVILYMMENIVSIFVRGWPVQTWISVHCSCQGKTISESFWLGSFFLTWIKRLLNLLPAKMSAKKLFFEGKELSIYLSYKGSQLSFKNLQQTYKGNTFQEPCIWHALILSL